MRPRIVVAALPLVPVPAFLALVLFPAGARASGFHIDEQDARATGRAGAITANPTNSSTIYYNPAGVAELTGFHVDAGVSLVAPSAKFTLPSTGAETAVDDKVFPLPQGYVTYRINDLVGVGVGFNMPFGLSLSWPETSPGRSNVRDIDLRAYFITPTVAMSLSEWAPGLSIGAGLDLVPSSVKLTRDILFGTDVGSVALGGKAFGAGARAGVLYRPKDLPQWSFGVTYRSPVKLSFSSGTANFDASPVFRASLPPDGAAKTSVVLPQTLDVGIAFDPMPEWQVEVDGNWLGWSSYDRLFIELPGNQTTVSAKNWKDTFAVRLGTEYTLQKRWSGRLGFIWDPTPVPDTTLDFQLPDADRYVLTAGVGAAVTPSVQADLGFLYVLPVHHTTSNADPLEPPIKGRFDIHAWVIGISVGVALPIEPSAPPPPLQPIGTLPAPTPSEPILTPPAAPPVEPMTPPPSTPILP